MAPSAIPSLDGRLYRAALCLYPAGFRREHADEMARDFDEARGEAAAAGDRALWILRLLIAVDLVRTFGVQWLRSGFPAIGLASILVSLTLAEGIATVARIARVQMPDEAVDGEVVGVLLLAVVTVVLIAMTITISLWVGRLNRRGRR